MSNLDVCKPVSKDHFRGFRWFASLAHMAEGSLNERDDGNPTLQQSMQLYSLYAQTGDARYLELCESFLRFSLAAS